MKHAETKILIRSSGLPLRDPYVSVEGSTKDRVSLDPKPLSSEPKAQARVPLSKSLSGTGNTNFPGRHHTSWELPETPSRLGAKLQE